LRGAEALLHLIALDFGGAVRVAAHEPLLEERLLEAVVPFRVLQLQLRVLDARLDVGEGLRLIHVGLDLRQNVAVLDDGAFAHAQAHDLPRDSGLDVHFCDRVHDPDLADRDLEVLRLHLSEPERARFGLGIRLVPAPGGRPPAPPAATAITRIQIHRFLRMKNLKNLRKAPGGRVSGLVSVMSSGRRPRRLLLLRSPASKCSVRRGPPAG
jgi:hypothetical protein